MSGTWTSFESHCMFRVVLSNSQCKKVAKGSTPRCADKVGRDRDCCGAVVLSGTTLPSFGWSSARHHTSFFFVILFARPFFFLVPRKQVCSHTRVHTWVWPTGHGPLCFLLVRKREGGPVRGWVGFAGEGVSDRKEMPRHPH